MVLREGDREVLESWTRSRNVRAGLVKRSRIVLMAAAGVANQEIADRVGASRTTVVLRRDRYQHYGVDGLEDTARATSPPACGGEANHARTRVVAESATDSVRRSGLDRRWRSVAALIGLGSPVKGGRDCSQSGVVRSRWRSVVEPSEGRHPEA